MSDSLPVRRLRALLHEQIPLAREMAVDVISWDAGGLEVAAPLAPNVNHHGTFFGGSASALGILAGWSLVHLISAEERLNADLVIQRVAVRYLAPARSRVVARADAPRSDARERFVSGYHRRGLARIRIHVTLLCEGVPVATVDAAYAAVRPADSP